MYKLDKTLDNKKSTTKYLLEIYHQELVKTKLNEKSSIPQCKTLLEKYNNDKLQDLTNLDQVKLEVYIKKYIQDIKRLIDYQEQNKYLLSSDELSKFILAKPTITTQSSKIKTSTQIMPNGEQKKVKSFRKQENNLNKEG